MRSFLANPKFARKDTLRRADSGKANFSPEPGQLLAESNPSAAENYFEEVLFHPFWCFLNGEL